MLKTLSQKGVWVNILALIASIAAAFGLDLGLDTKTQTEIAVGLAGLVAVINTALHAVQRSREKKATSGQSPGSINTSMLLLPIVLSLCLFVSACASMPAPHTPKQTLAYTESSYTAVVETLNDLHDQGALTPAQEDRIDTWVHRGNADLDAAHAALSAGDTSTLQGKLSALDAVLVHLRDMIAKEATDGQ